VQNKLAVLIALAKRPEGRATPDELRDDVARLIAEAEEEIGNLEQHSALDHIDLLRSGLVATEGSSLRITENGCSFIRALEITTQESPDADRTSTLRTASLMDNLISREARRDLAARPTDQNTDLIPPHDQTIGPEASGAAGGNDGSRDEVRPGLGNEASAPHNTGEIASGVHAFLIRKFGYAAQAFRRSSLLTMLTMRMQQGIDAWRRHLQQDQPPKATRRSSTNVERGLFALLSLLVVVSGACVAIALIQVKSVRSELSALQRELLPLKERVARLDQIERSKEIAEKVSEQKIQSPRESRAEEAPLLLSREEIQLVRDYIKPAPVVGSSTTPINVGDPVTGPMIPFPSPVTEKVPKLLGARFTIRNGTIIIVKKDSRQADAVLGPN
jgi:hypothetical protein